jgi:hypothetical protein
VDRQHPGSPPDQAGQAVIAAALEDSHESWLEDAAATIIGLAHTLPEFSADDLAREMRKPPLDKLPGLAFSAARNAGYIEAIGYQTSTNRTRKHGVLRTWRRKVNEGAS